MNVQPEVIHHPKFLRLRGLIGDRAMEYLIALWGHCQGNQRGEFWNGADASYVETICTGKPRKGRVFRALMEAGWIKERDGGVEVHDWDAHNKILIGRWRRTERANQQLLSVYARPAQDLSSACVESTQDLSSACVEPAPATGSRQEGRGGEGRGVEGSGVSAQHKGSAGLTPSLEQAYIYFERNSYGYSREEIRAAWLSLESTKHPEGYWTFGKAMVTDWRTALTSRIEYLRPKNSARPPANETRIIPPPPGPGCKPIDDSMFRTA